MQRLLIAVTVTLTTGGCTIITSPPAQITVATPTPPGPTNSLVSTNAFYGRIQGMGVPMGNFV